jgi:hypothetical protein
MPTEGEILKQGLEQKSIKIDDITREDVRKWKSRAETSNKIHRKIIMPRLDVARNRYNSELEMHSNFADKNTAHGDVNLLFKAIRDFIASVFFRNPTVDLSAKQEANETFRRNIENLEQLTNDDIKDNRTLKKTFRACFVNESLGGIAPLGS